MSVFFKIADDGKSVYVARTMFSNEMKEKEFDKKATRISVDKFLSKFPKNISEKMEGNINRVRKISEMNLSKLGSESLSNPVTRTTSVFYTVGDKVFCEDYGEYERDHEYGAAKQYLEEFYGKEFAKDNEEKLRNERGYRYFSGTEEISKESYLNLSEEKKMLTNIICLQQEKKQTVKR